MQTFQLVTLLSILSASASTASVAVHGDDQTPGSIRKLGGGGGNKTKKPRKPKTRKPRKPKTTKPTSAPVEITSAPVDATAAPVDATSAPVDATSAPVDTDDDGQSRLDLSQLRFNKAPPLDEADKNPTNNDYVNGVHEALYPLEASDYPVNGLSATILRLETMADAVVVSNDFQLFGQPADSAPWLNDPVSGAIIDPEYPGNSDGTSNSEYWEELRVVVEAQIARRAGQDPADFNRWPDIWDDKTTLEDMAKAVMGEYPASIQATYLETVYKALAKGVRIQVELGQPFRSFTDFIGNQIRMAAINTWTFQEVAPVNFMLKWFFGVPRPEEIAWLISKGDITADMGVPADLIALVDSMNLVDAHDFTAYPNGCPMHPAFPAMHSAGSTVSLWLPTVYVLTGEQYCEALRVDYATSFGRTIAGVHYQQDNLAGLNIGQRLIREGLPGFLEEEYGYDPVQVAARANALSFDWNTFDSVACTIDGVPAADFLANAN